MCEAIVNLLEVQDFALENVDAFEKLTEAFWRLGASSCCSDLIEKAVASIELAERKLLSSGEDLDDDVVGMISDAVAKIKRRHRPRSQKNEL